MARSTPERFNLAEAVCRRHADRVTRVALLDVKRAAENCFTFGGLDYLSDKFAVALTACGIRAGDAVAVALDQSAALVVAELGALKCGAAVVPLSRTLAPAALAPAIHDSGARALVAPFEERSDYAAIARQAASIHTLFLAGDSRQAIHYEGAERSFWRDVFIAASDFTPFACDASAPAFIFYAPADDGSLRRVVHSHAAMLERLAAVEAAARQDEGEGDTLWCGDDWAAADLRLGMIYPAWWRGSAVVTKPPGGLTAESALQLFERCGVTAAFLRADLLDELLSLAASEPARFTLKLRTVIARDEEITGDHRQRAGAMLGATLRGFSEKW
jgi:acyl-coenzyme A synthetase/AMP-(fatty) acid ligase